MQSIGAQWKQHRLSIGIFASAVVGLWLFDLPDRWTLAGTWDCERYSNGARTQETFGIFGAHETVDYNSPVKGMIIVATYRLSGKHMVSTVQSFKRGDKAIELNQLQNSDPVVIDMRIGKLSKTQLTFSLDGNSADKCSCTRQ